MIETDYTAEARTDTLRGGAMQSYRLLHWLADILRNWFSDPINIKDERIARLLRLQDGDTDETLDALFDIGTPYSQESKKACTTPMILVGLGESKFLNNPLNITGGVTALNGARVMHAGARFKQTALTVAVITESYDGTVLLAGLIEDFLCINEMALAKDNGSISEFHVHGSTAPQEIKQGTASNAKPVYQTTISLSAVGGISWTTDTQGPVFRGLTMQTTLK